MDDLFGDVLFVKHEAVKSVSVRARDEVYRHRSKEDLSVSGHPLTWWQEHQE